MGSVRPPVRFRRSAPFPTEANLPNAICQVLVLPASSCSNRRLSCFPKKKSSGIGAPNLPPGGGKYTTNPIFSEENTDFSFYVYFLSSRPCTGTILISRCYMCIPLCLPKYIFFCCCFCTGLLLHPPRKGQLLRVAEPALRTLDSDWPMRPSSSLPSSSFLPADQSGASLLFSFFLIGRSAEVRNAAPSSLWRHAKHVVAMAADPATVVWEQSTSRDG